MSTITIINITLKDVGFIYAFFYEKAVAERKNKGKGKNIVIIMLSVLLIIALGFICYDKFLIKEKTIKQDCKCPKCEKCNAEIEKPKQEEDKICELDMKDKKVLDVYSMCSEQGISNARNVKIKNISIKGNNYVLFHEFTPFYDLKGTYVNFNGITKLYLNGTEVESESL